MNGVPVFLYLWNIDGKDRSMSTADLPSTWCEQRAKSISFCFGKGRVGVHGGHQIRCQPIELGLLCCEAF